MRFKNRYLVIDVPSAPSGSLDAASLYRSWKISVTNACGEYGTAIVVPSVKYCNALTNTAVVRVAREGYQLMAPILAMGMDIEIDVDVNVGTKEQQHKQQHHHHQHQRQRYRQHVLHVAGSMRAAQKALVRHTNKRLVRNLAQQYERHVRTMLSRAETKADKPQESIQG